MSKEISVNNVSMYAKKKKKKITKQNSIYIEFIFKTNFNSAILLEIIMIYIYHLIFESVYWMIAGMDGSLLIETTSQQYITTILPTKL